MQEPVRIGILGTGRIVRRWLRDVPPQARIVAIASREETRAAEAAHAYGIDSYCASYEALYARTDVDAVYVAMPNQGHMENAMAAMRAGKHVLCEKPAGVNAAQWERMTECARKNGVLLMEAMWTRCFPAMRRLLAVLAEGKIGTLQAVQANFAGRTQEKSGSRLLDPAQAGGSLLDIGCYCIHFANACFGGAPDRVTGTLTIGASGVDDQAGMVLQYAQGGLATLFSSITTTTPSTAQLFGTQGSIIVPDFWHPHRLILRTEDTPECIEEFPYAPEGFAFEVTHFCDCIQRGLRESDWVSWADTRAVLRVMDTLRAQAGLRFPCEEVASCQS